MVLAVSGAERGAGAGSSPDFMVAVVTEDSEQGRLCWEMLAWGPRVQPQRSLLSPGAEAREGRSLERFKLARRVTHL